MILDRFSNAAHFILLPSLPIAMKASQLITQHVFQIHGIPADIVSDHGPQLISQVWKSFCG